MWRACHSTTGLCPTCGPNCIFRACGLPPPNVPEVRQMRSRCAIRYAMYAAECPGQHPARDLVRPCHACNRTQSSVPAGCVIQRLSQCAQLAIRRRRLRRMLPRTYRRSLQAVDAQSCRGPRRTHCIVFHCCSIYGSASSAKVWGTGLNLPCHSLRRLRTNPCHAARPRDRCRLDCVGDHSTA